MRCCAHLSTALLQYSLRGLDPADSSSPVLRVQAWEGFTADDVLLFGSLSAKWTNAVSRRGQNPASMRFSARTVAGPVQAGWHV
jgi:hypothetical protein